MLTGLSRLKSVLNADFLQHRNREDKIDIIFWELRDIEQTLKELRYNQPYKHVIVDIHTHKIKEFLQAAAAMGLLTTYHHYMFTSLVGKAYFSLHFFIVFNVCDVYMVLMCFSVMV